MLVVMDEFGDTGLKFTQGSSSLMIVAAVVFYKMEEAEAVANRLIQLRAELGLSPKFEFHFKDNSRSIREAFFRVIARFDFVCTGVVIDKARLQTSGYTFGKGFYQDACGQVLDCIRERLGTLKD